jgi:hypothetical protein
MIIGPGITFTGGIYIDANAPAASSGGIVTSGLQFNLATAPSTGSTWTDSSGSGRNATLLGSPSYVSSNGGGIRLNNEDNNGTDYISVPYNIASNTVTVEVVASFNPTSTWGTIWGNEFYDNNSGYLAYLGSNTEISYGIPNSETTETITASDAIRQWIFVINGTQVSLYLNGSQVGTTDTISNQTLFATSEFYFGSRHLNDGTGATDKLNNSNAAFYPVFYQMRGYNKALSGAEITQNFNAVKDTYGLESPPSDDFSGSGSFNVTASNQTYQIPVNSAFTYGTGDFTVEWYSYQTGTSGVQGIWRNSTGDATNSIGFWTITQSGGRLVVTLGNGVTSNTIQSNAVITTNSWKHYAFVRNGTLFKLYVDGVAQTQTITSSISIPAQVGIMQIGNAGGNYSGFITNFRIVKGTAVYTSDFTPPTTTLTAISGTSLLLKFSSAALLTKDDSPFNHTITNTGTTTYSVGSPYVTAGVVASGLALSLDAGTATSYPGSGTVWTDTTSGKVFRLYNGGRVSQVQTDPPTYNSANGGYIQFDNSKRQWANCTTAFSDLNSYTIEGWWYLDGGNLTTSVFNLLADKNNSRYNYALGMGQVTSNKFSLYHLKAGAVPKIDSDNNASTYFNTGWMHICGTFNNPTSKMNLYINGALAATEVTISSGGTPFSGGAGISMATRNDTSSDTQYNFLNGGIAVARIYNTALTSAQVTQNYNAQRARFGL